MLPRFSTFRIYSGANGTWQAVFPTSAVTGPICSPIWMAVPVSGDTYEPTAIINEFICRRAASGACKMFFCTRCNNRFYSANSNSSSPLIATRLPKVAQPAAATSGFLESIHSNPNSQPYRLPAVTHATVEPHSGTQ